MQRIYGLDILKIVCCFSVVVLHAVVYRVEQVDTSVSWMVANILSAATREAVPVFFMISGALLLRRDIPSYPAYFKKIARNYALPLFGGLIAYKILARCQGDAAPILSGVVYNVRDSIAFHLWFMWTFLGLTLIAPLLRSMVTRRDNVALFLGLWLLFCIAAPWLERIPVAVPVDNMLFVRDTGYFVAGYALFSLSRRVPAWLLWLGCLTAVAATAWLTRLDSLATGTLSLMFYEGPSPFLVLYSACAFALGLWMRPGPLPGLVRAVSGATFTVYIYHILALSLLSRFLGPTTLFMRVCVQTPLAFAVCVAWDALGRRTPYLRVFFR